MAIASTHPWINFSPDLRKASFKLWMLLGQVEARCAYILGVPLKPSVAMELNEVYLTKGVLATTAIEGNTLTEKQVREIIKHEEYIPPSQEYLAQEVKNIVNACNEIFEDLALGKNTLMTTKKIESYNSKIFERLPIKKDVSPGKIRLNNVGVGSYKAPEAKYCQELVVEFCQWYNSFEENLKLDRIPTAILKASLSHLYFVWIHPFDDGNGRTARLIEFETLLAGGLPAPVAHLLSNHYNLTRTEYYRQLDQASRTGECLDFVTYAIQGLSDQIDEQIKLIRAQQLAIAWKEFVYDLFVDKDNQTDVRQRYLALDLSFEVNAPVPKNKVRRISPRLAELYANKTDKTVSRDLNKLEEMHLIRRTPAGYVANKEFILAFLPPTCEDIGLLNSLMREHQLQPDLV